MVGLFPHMSPQACKSQEVPTADTTSILSAAVIRQGYICGPNALHIFAMHCSLLIRDLAACLTR